MFRGRKAPATSILQAAKDKNLKSVVVVGVTQTGEPVVSSSELTLAETRALITNCLDKLK